MASSGSLVSNILSQEIYEFAPGGTSETELLSPRASARDKCSSESGAPTNARSLSLILKRSVPATSTSLRLPIRRSSYPSCCPLSASQTRSSSTPSAHRPGHCHHARTGRVLQRTSSHCRRLRSSVPLRSALSHAPPTWALRGLLAAARNVVSSFRDDHFRGIPRSALSTLSSAVESSAYGPRFSADNYSAQGNVRSIRTTDMPVFGALTLDTAPAAVVPPEIATEHRLREADFLISRTGFTSGRAAVFRGADASTVFIPAAFLVRLRLDPRKLEPEYLLEYIQSTEGWEMIRGLQRGTQQLNISASGLVARTVPIPDLQCQRQALEQLSTLHAAADSTCRRIAQTQSLLRAAGAALMGSVS